MSFLLTCPNCGPRDVSEFRYGGQIMPAPARAGEPAGAAGAMGSNLPGPQHERWYHRFGCRRWLVAQRNVQTNQVLSTAWLSSETAKIGGEQAS